MLAKKGKCHQLPYPRSTSISSSPLELVFSDVWGPTPTYVGKNSYYVSFIDDFSKFTWVFLLRHKSDVFQKFHEFQKMVEHQFDRKIITMQTDWGGEYQKLNAFSSALASPIMFPAPMRINKMGQLSTNTAISLK